MATPKRPTILGFYVENPLGSANPIAFLNLSLTQSGDVMTKHHIKEVHYTTVGGKTAVRIRTEKQHYVKAWRAIIKELFSEASKTLGGDAMLDFDEESSDKIKALFRERERKSPASVIAFKVPLNHPI